MGAHRQQGKQRKRREPPCLPRQLRREAKETHGSGQRPPVQGGGGGRLEAGKHGAGDQCDFEGADARLVARLLDSDVPLRHGPLDFLIELLIVILVFLRGEMPDDITTFSISRILDACSVLALAGPWSLSVTSTDT